MGPGNENNIKFISPDGHGEAVFNPDGTLVTDPVNMGTYNFNSPNELLGVPHFVNDVLPYYVWGNSPEDPTTTWDLVKTTYKGGTQ